MAAYGAQGVAEALALRTYSARLLGGTIPVLCVKGSRWDLATIEPPGHPAVRLEPVIAQDTAWWCLRAKCLVGPLGPERLEGCLGAASRRVG